MAERQVDIILKARDEASSTFKRVAAEAEAAHGIFRRIAQSSKELNLESRRSGEAALERIIRGGGAIGLATFALEIFGKTAEAATESLGKFHAGLIDEQQAIAETADGFVKSMPIFGTWVENLTKMRIATQEFAYEQAILRGVDREWAEDNIRSAEKVKDTHEKLNAVIDRETAMMRKASDEAKVSGLRGRARQVEEEEQHYAEQTRKLTEERQKARKDLSEAGLGESDESFRSAMRKFKSIQDQITEAHENRLKMIESRPIAIRFAADVNDKFLTGLKQLAEERMAMLNNVTHEGGAGATGGEKSPAEPGTAGAARPEDRDAAIRRRKAAAQAKVDHDEQMLAQLEEQNSNQESGSIWDAARRRKIKELRDRLPGERDVARYGTKERARVQREMLNDINGTNARLARERGEHLASFDMADADLSKLPAGAERERLRGLNHAKRDAEAHRFDEYARGERSRSEHRTESQYEYAQPRIGAEIDRDNRHAANQGKSEEYLAQVVGLLGRLVGAADRSAGPKIPVFHR